MEEEVLFEKKVGYKYRVYKNRVEIERPGLMRPRVDVVYIKNIAKIETKGLAGVLQIVDTGGKVEKLSGIAGADAQKVREIINSLM